jgi:hypothetical protein
MKKFLERVVKEKKPPLWPQVFLPSSPPIEQDCSRLPLREAQFNSTFTALEKYRRFYTDEDRRLFGAVPLPRAVIYLLNPFRQLRPSLLVAASRLI